MPQFNGTIDSDDGRNQVVGLHFRMKGLNKGEPKSIKQLRLDGEALMQEHAGVICATEDAN